MNSQKKRERIENGFDKAPWCPECNSETVVRPEHQRGGNGLVATVNCLSCKYTGHFYPDEPLKTEKP